MAIVRDKKQPRQADALLQVPPSTHTYTDTHTLALTVRSYKVLVTIYLVDCECVPTLRQVAAPSCRYRPNGQRFVAPQGATCAICAEAIMAKLPCNPFSLSPFLTFRLSLSCCHSLKQLCRNVLQLGILTNHQLYREQEITCSSCSNFAKILLKVLRIWFFNCEFECWKYSSASFIILHLLWEEFS